MPVYIFISDVGRYVSVIASLLVIAASIRLVYMRWRAMGFARLWRETQPHPASVAAVGVFLMLGTSHRFENLGEPADICSWAYLFAVCLLVVGLGYALQVDMRAAWRRR